MLGDIDLAADDSWVDGVPHAHFARLRRTDPVSWNDSSSREPFWSITRYHDIKKVSSSPLSFRSGSGPFTFTIDRRFLEGSKSLINLDPPKHTEVRNAIVQLFPERQELSQLVTQAVEQSLTSLPDHFDFVTQVAEVIPDAVISSLLGIKGRSDVESIISTVLSQEASESDARRINLLLGLMWSRMRARKPAPPFVDCMFHSYATTDSHECTNNLLLLLLAGYETTKNALCQAAELVFRGRIDLPIAPARARSTAREVLRYQTPVRHMCRRVSEDLIFRGKRMRKDDLVTLWYCSGNFDGTVFRHPYKFIPERTGLPHLAFGAGTHSCMGASLALLELETFLARFSMIAGEYRMAMSPTYQTSAFVSTPKRMLLRRIR